MDAASVGAIVLAAGAGSRFRAADPGAGSKLLAPLDGLPVLQHVLDALADLGFGVTVVVLGSDGDAIESTISWRDEQRVRNPTPERGLSGSVRVGLAALATARSAAIEAALILLGDQPRPSRRVVRELMAAADEDRARPIVAPRYAGGGGSNPILLRREAWLLAGELAGDRGFGPVVEAHPELVLSVPVEGTIADIDTPDDLDALSRA